MQIANCKLQIGLIALVSLLTPRLGVAQEGDDLPRPPAVGRPEGFDEDEGPIGSFQTPTVRAEPTELQVEDPLTFTIRVNAAGLVQRPPRQLRLENLPGFGDQFYVEYPQGPEFRRLDDRSWELVCTLKPRSSNVKSVPSFPFVFFTPGFLPPQRGYQIQRTPSIAITVRPRSAVQERDVQGGISPGSVPEAVYRRTDGPALLWRSSQWSLDALLIAGILGLIVPPVVAVGWCIVWRRLHPDAARRGRQRRSQAARRALAGRRALNGDEEAMHRSAALVTAYLGERFDLAVEEPTPREVGAHLEMAGCAVDLAAYAVEFFRACDAARFAQHDTSGVGDLAATAQKLILDLEAHSCQVPASS